MRFEGRSLNKPVGGGAGRVAKRKHNEVRLISLFLLIRSSLNLL